MRQKKLVYYGKKCLIFLISVFILSVAVFYVARLAPGDPLISYYGDRTEKMSPEERERAMEKLGLNEPISVQYVKWVKNAFHGEFGISFKYKQDVVEVIGGRIGNTLVLGGIGFIIMFAGALLLGILCAWYENRLADRILCKLGTISSCIPEFWMALVLILVFSAYSTGNAGDIGDRVLHLIMPLTIVVMEHLWYYAYMIRNKILEEVRADYVLLAKAKGLDKKKLMFRHCVRNVMPGIGALSYESARYHDYNLLMLLCMMSGILVIFCNIVSQTINEQIDPRMKDEVITEKSEVVEG